MNSFEKWFNGYRLDGYVDEHGYVDELSTKEAYKAGMLEILNTLSNSDGEYMDDVTKKLYLKLEAIK